MPAISILFPFRNGGAHLGAALRSMTDQHFRDWELLALDHGSTDGSADLVRRCGDPRVRMVDVQAEPNLGAVLNRGWDAATGPYIARMDADDVAYPERLGAQLTFMERASHVEVCGTWIRILSAHAPRYVLRFPVGADMVHAFTLFAAPFSHPTVMLRRAAFEKSGLRYREDMPAAQDTDLWTRCAGVVGMDNLARPLLDYRVHEASVTVGRSAISRSCVCECLRRMLAPLVPDMTDAQIEMHARIGNGEGVGSMQELAGVRDWLLNLLERNRAVATYPVDGLDAAASMVWFRVCANSTGLGPRALGAWIRSSGLRTYRASLAESVSFVAGAILRRRRTRGKEV